jgi:hypothetical protein
MTYDQEFDQEVTVAEQSERSVQALSHLSDEVPTGWFVTCDYTDHEHKSLYEARRCAYNER